MHEFVRVLDKYVKTEWVRLLATVQDRIPRAFVEPTRAPERSAEIKPKKRS